MSKHWVLGELLRFAVGQHWWSRDLKGRPEDGEDDKRWLVPVEERGRKPPAIGSFVSWIYMRRLIEKAVKFLFIYINLWAAHTLHPRSINCSSLYTVNSAAHMQLTCFTCLETHWVSDHSVTPVSPPFPLFSKTTKVKVNDLSLLGASSASSALVSHRLDPGPTDSGCGSGSESVVCFAFSQAFNEF